MKKKGHDSRDDSFFVIDKDPSNEYCDSVSIHIVGDKVFIEDVDGFETIILSAEQAKQLSYFINDRLVRPVDFGDDND